jgi:3-oxoacyl-[acyl-carrier protein] reductase
LSTGAISRWKVGDSCVLTHTFTNNDVDSFATLTGDDNPVHVDEAFARRTPAGGQVVHGMLAASFLSTLIGTRIPGPGALWLSFSVRWTKPVRIGDAIRLEATVKAVHSSIGVLDLTIRGEHQLSGEEYLRADARVMVMEADEAAGEAAPLPATGKLAGRRILVTGASGELGLGIARLLAADGADLVLWGRNRARLDAIAGELGASVMEVDLENDRQVVKAVAAVARHGGLYGIVHAAAPPTTPVAADHADCLDEMKAHWQVGPGALQRMVAGLAPGLEKGGAIVAVLTQYVIGPPPGRMAPYVSAKMALLGYVRALAVELGGRGIRCNAVSPGMMNTPYSRDVPVSVKQIEAATNPMRRLCSVEEAARAVAFLMSPESGFINGVNLPVSGGSAMP